MLVGYINYDICIMHKSELQCLLIDPLYFSFYLNTCIYLITQQIDAH